MKNTIGEEQRKTNHTNDEENPSVDRVSSNRSRSFDRVCVDRERTRTSDRSTGEENPLVDRASNVGARSFEPAFVDPGEERWNADNQAAESGIAMNRRELSTVRSLAPARASEPVKFVAYDVALELIRALAPVVKQIARHSADLADQIVRAASSITLNLSEGSGRRGKDRKRFFLFAQGSAKEIRGALDTARAWGWRIDAEAAYALLDRELRLLWGLCR